MNSLVWDRCGSWSKDNFSAWQCSEHSFFSLDVLQYTSGAGWEWYPSGHRICALFMQMTAAPRESCLKGVRVCSRSHPETGPKPPARWCYKTGRQHSVCLKFTGPSWAQTHCRGFSEKCLRMLNIWNYSYNSQYLIFFCILCEKATVHLGCFLLVWLGGQSVV